VPRDFATELFNFWGIGKKGKDNGLLLLVVIGQRRWEFEVGYGLEGTLPDATMRRIGEALPPYFKKGDYGPGILAVSRTIAGRLGPRPAAAPLTEEQRRRAAQQQEARRRQQEEADRQSRRAFAYVVSGLTLFYALIAFAVRGSGARAYARRDDSDRRKDPTVLPPMPLLLWLFLTFAWVPVAAVLVFWLYDPAPLPAGFGAALEEYGPWGLGGFAYIWGSILGAQRHVRAGRAALAPGGDPYLLHKRFTESQRGRTVGMLFCPLFYVPYSIYAWRKGRALRTQARSCGECASPLRRLGEKEDDVHLDEGRRLEEELGSIDYDAWYCGAGGHVLVLPYTGSSRYSSCEKCSYRTSLATGSRTITSPSYDYAGTGAQYHECRHCGRTKETTYTIPRLVRSTSSSSSSSSSSGGSFGGGRSGGAGAGGSW
jgi:uncharacterized protein